MNDDLDPLDELASAYLDDQVTPDERARVEADPGLTARVDALRAVRSVLASPEATDPGERSRAIAAALDLFDGLEEPTSIAVGPAGPAAATPDQGPTAARASVTSITRSAAFERRRTPRQFAGMLLGAAAAVLAVVGVGAALIRFSGDHQSNSSSSAGTFSAAATTSPAVAAKGAATITAIDGAADVNLPAAAPAGAGNAATEAAAATTAAGAATTAASATTAAAGVGGGATTTSAPSAPGPRSAPVALSSTDELIALSRTLVEQNLATTTGSTASFGAPACPLGLAASPVLWRGTPGTLFLGPDPSRPTTATVVDASCTVLTTATLP